MNKRIRKKFSKRCGCKSWKDYHTGFAVLNVSTNQGNQYRKVRIADFITQLSGLNRNGRYYSPQVVKEAFDNYMLHGGCRYSPR